MSDLPDGVDQFTMKLAIDWEMVELSLHDSVDFDKALPNMRLTMLAETFGHAYYSVLNPKKDKVEEE